MTTDDGVLINRTGLFIISFQLEGLCTGLRLTVPHGLSPTAGSIALLKKLHDDFASISTGRSLDDFPPIDDSLSPVDVLVIAETLRSTVASFLTPDEREERDKTFGFAPHSRNDAR
ncbi:MAG: hypothetical protein AAGI68_15090 [Planctomycetota bacterium]